MKSSKQKVIRERDIERYLVQQLKLRGSEVRKVKWIGRRGAPDRVFWSPIGPVFVEVKRPSKFLTDAQSREHARVNRFCQSAYLVNSFASVDSLLFQCF